MSEKQTAQDLKELNQVTRDIWNRNAAFWDSQMGDGNDFQRILVGPATERLLDLQPGELVLEVGCGNGVFARRMVQLGAQVVACDFSEQLLERARARTIEYTDRIEYTMVDVTSEEQLLALGTRRFDASVCNMAIMDIAEIDPMMRGICQVLKPGGRFVFTIMHPCFNIPGVTMVAEERDQGELVTTRAVKVTQYLHLKPQSGIGIVGQPAPHYYFHRPLHVLLNAAFRTGMVMDGIEEPAFDHPKDGSKPSSRVFSWVYYREIPPVLTVRLRVAFQ